MSHAQPVEPSPHARFHPGLRARDHHSHDKADSLYTDLGSDAKYASVGLLEYRTESGRGVATAQYIGVGMGKKWLLTAAHVFEGLTSLTFTIGARTYNVPTASLKANPDTLTGKDDIGVGEISDPGNMLNVAPAVFTNYSIPISTDLAARTIGTFVGFGDTGNGEAGETSYDGKKRACQNTLDCLNGTYKDGARTLYGYTADFDNSTAAANTLDKTDFDDADFPASQKSSRTWLNLEGQGADGDSGGGLFADVGGSTLLIGIESGAKRLGGTNLATYGAYTVWTPMDAAASDKVKSWTGIQGVPEPSQWLALAAGLTMLTVMLRMARLKAGWTA